MFTPLQSDTFLRQAGRTLPDNGAACAMAGAFMVLVDAVHAHSKRIRAKP